MDLNFITNFITILGTLTLATALGALLTRDNFYSALYMSLTMLFVAGIYALYNLQPSVVLITLVFVGAVGVITIAIAATYRAQSSRKISLAWALVIAIVSATLILHFPSAVSFNVLSNGISFLSNYLLAVLFLLATMVLVMLSTIKIIKEVGR
ncbi:MAG: hypothetical protein PWQ22_973 [Archaeoglobaceae archaeon]|nr:hypothetical protein [Archaeoglobaceae archaeon]MDK2876563.1 hypothetical protein [Archaeoglobaceae archaeon]